MCVLNRPVREPHACRLALLAPAASIGWAGPVRHLVLRNQPARRPQLDKSRGKETHHPLLGERACFAGWSQGEVGRRSLP
jgi:hypothetical protein